jgi:hypothetical protein
MKTRAKILTMLFVALVIAPTVTGEVIFVDADAHGANDGSSWNDAFNYLQDALANAHSGDEIRVAQGTYRPDRGAGITPGDRTSTFWLIDGVNLKGGYAGFGEPDPDERNINKYETVLSGDLAENDVEVRIVQELWNEPSRAENSFHVVRVSLANPRTILDGFMITAGNANVDYPGYDGRRGGGMYNRGNPTIKNCTFKYNSALSCGGGMCNIDSEPVLINCTFEHNSSVSGGGTHNRQDNDLTLINCRFNGNWARDRGGGICHISDGITTLTNCVFSGNITQRYYGGGIYGSGLVINNCTFTENLVNPYSNPAYGGSGGGLYGSNKITNSIFWGNVAGSKYRYQQLSPDSDISYSCIQDWAVWGQGNNDVDPCFVLPGFWADVNDTNIIVEPNHPNAVWIDGDYHLKSEGWRWDSVRDRWHYDEATSRCIDAGNPGSPLEDEPPSVADDPNNLWGHNIRINMGAYGGTTEASMPPYDWSLLADLNNDGKVNSIDLSHWKENWIGSSDDLPGDFDRDRFVNMVDFSLFARDWLKRTSFWITEPPFVRITKPEDGSSFAWWEEVEIEAEAWDVDGEVVRVEFFSDTVKAGEDYDGSDGWCIIRVLSSGKFLTARATDNSGATSVSRPIKVYISMPFP